MKIRLASLFAAVALNVFAAPAFGQDGPGDPPPLPEEWVEPSGPDETGVSWAQNVPPQAYGQPAVTYGGYTPEQRAWWLQECWRTYEPADQCEAILAGYERALVAAPGYAYGPSANAYGAPAYGYGPYGAYGYGAWPPVMWVRVPIVTERRNGPAPLVQPVIEQEVVAPAPAHVQRSAPAPTKNTKIVR